MKNRTGYSNNSPLQNTTLPLSQQRLLQLVPGSAAAQPGECWKRRFVAGVPRGATLQPYGTARSDMRAGHVTRCIIDTCRQERGVCNAAVRRDDPAGSVIWDQSSVQTLSEVHHVIHPPKTLPRSLCAEALLCYTGNLNLLVYTVSTMAQDIYKNLYVPPYTQHSLSVGSQNNQDGRSFPISCAVKLWDAAPWRPS